MLGPLEQRPRSLCHELVRGAPKSVGFRVGDVADAVHPECTVLEIVMGHLILGRRRYEGIAYRRWRGNTHTK